MSYGPPVTVKELTKVFKYMNKKRMFKELVYYIMACRSGSIFQGQLNEDGNSKKLFMKVI